LGDEQKLSYAVVRANLLAETASTVPLTALSAVICAVAESSPPNAAPFTDPKLVGDATRRTTWKWRFLRIVLKN